MMTLKVSATTSPGKLAGAVAGQLRTGEPVRLQAVGAGAVNQAVKALAMAESYMHRDDLDLAFRVRLVDVEVTPGRVRTVVRFLAWAVPAPERTAAP